MKIKQKNRFKKGLITTALAGSLLLAPMVAFADSYLTKTEQTVRTSSQGGASFVILNNDGKVNKKGSNEITVYNARVYLSEDGKTRYIKGTTNSNGVGNENWYQETNGTWQSISDPPKASDDPTGEAESTYSASHNSSYSDLSDGGTKNDTGSATGSSVNIGEKQAKEDADMLTNYYSELSLGKLNTPANLLQSVILKGASKDGLRSKSISMKDLARYPKEEYVDSSAKADGDKKAQEVTVGVFEYGNLKQRETVSKVGSTTANMIDVLAQQGWITTSQKDERSVKWYTTLWDSISNPVTSIVAITAVALGSIAEPLTDAFMAIIHGARNVIGFLFPDRIFGFATQETTGFFAETTKGAEGKFVTAIKNFVDTVFGTGQIGLFKLIVTIMMTAWVLISIVQVVVGFVKGGIRGVIQPLKLLALRFFAYISFFVLVSGINRIINIAFQEKEQVTQKNDNQTFDSLKFMVATNGDLSVIYPDNYTSTQAGHVLSASEIRDTFKVTPALIQDANERVNKILGSELSAQIDSESKTDKATGKFDKLTSGEQTWNVNNYLNLISDSSNTNLASTRLPAGMSWSNDLSNKNTYAVMPGRVSGVANFQDVVPSGTFNFYGAPVFFNSLSDNQENGGEEAQFVSVNGRMGVTYDPELFNPIVLSQSEPSTYLFGATENNSFATSNPANYTFYKGLNFNKDLTSAVGGSIQVEEGGEAYSTQKKNGSVGTEEDLKATKSKVDTKTLQWENAYMIAMFNKYAGTNVSDASDFYGQPVGSYGFATQSALILMQSTYQNGSMTYTGYNSNFSNADKGKAQTKDNVYLQRFTMPSSTNTLANAVSRTAFGAISACIVAFGAMLAIYKYGTVTILKDAWVAIWRFIKNGSFTGMAIYLLAKIAYALTFGSIDIFMKIIDYMTNVAVNSIVDSFSIDASATAVIGVIMIGTSVMFVKPTIKIGGRKESVVSIIFGLIGMIYEMLKQPMERLDQFAYGTSDSYSSGASNDNLYDRAERGVKHGARNVISTVGSTSQVLDYLNGDGEAPTGGSGGGSGLPTGAGGSETGSGGGDSDLPSSSGGASFKDFMKQSAKRSMGGIATGARAIAKKHSGKLLVGASSMIPFGNVALGAYYAGRTAMKGRKAFKQYKDGAVSKDKSIPKSTNTPTNKPAPKPVGGGSGKAKATGTNFVANKAPKTRPTTSQQVIRDAKLSGRALQQRAEKQRAKANANQKKARKDRKTPATINYEKSNSKPSSTTFIPNSARGGNKTGRGNSYNVTPKK